MAPLGMSAPDFRLPDPDGKMVSLQDFKDAPALLVLFICNHCPFVQYIQSHLAETATEYLQRGVAVVGINSNDIQTYADDSPEKMAEQARTVGFDFPYLLDESQEVAKAYGAACTPDFFLFDRDGKLAYRGQYDDSRPATTSPSPAPIFAPRWMRCSEANLYPPTRNPAWAATSSGSRGTNRATSAPNKCRGRTFDETQGRRRGPGVCPAD
jgi:peroxiredoxin